MDKPTFQEVKERFKNAKEVKCACGCGSKEQIDIETLHDFNDLGICVKSEYHNVIHLYHFEKGYAEIISYKEPLYQLTAKEIVYGAENPQWLKDTFKECFETELECGKWYRNEDCGNLVFYKSDEQDCYGFGYNYYSYHNNLFFNKKDYNWQQATKKEVEEVLKNYFEKTNGISFKYYNFSSEYNRLLGWDGSVRHNLFQDGTWKKPPTYTIPEAEKTFNIKIKAV